MKKTSTRATSRSASENPQHILEWHGLSDNESDDYIALLRQDVLEPKEAACAIYPRPSGQFDAALEGDDGRMAALLLRIEIAMRRGALDWFRHHDQKLIVPEKLLDWAWRSKLIDKRLKERFQRIRAGKKGESGNPIQPLRKDVEILGAAVAVLAAEFNKSHPEDIRGGTLAKKIEENAELFWADAEPPKGHRPLGGMKLAITATAAPATLAGAWMSVGGT